MKTIKPLFLLLVVLVIVVCGFMYQKKPQSSKKVCTSPSFEHHKQYRDEHNHNISYDTLEGVLYIEYVLTHKTNSKKKFNGEVCRALFFVKSPSQPDTYIDTLNVCSEDALNISDTSCAYLQKQRMEISKHQDVIFKSKTIHHFYSRNDLDTLFYISNAPKIQGESRLAAARNATIIGATYWNIRLAEYTIYEIHALASEAFRESPTECWINIGYPPPDFIQVMTFYNSSPLDSLQLQKHGLTPSHFKSWIYDHMIPYPKGVFRPNDGIDMDRLPLYNLK